MWRFVLKENIRRFEALLGQAASTEEHETLRQLIHEAQMELDELEEASTPEVAKRDAGLSYFASRAVDQAMALDRAQFASLQIFDESRKHLIIVAQRNLRADFLHYLMHVKPGDGSACGRCLQDDAPAVTNDVNSDAAFAPHRKAASEAGFQAVRASPVRDASGKLIAVLSTYFEAPQCFYDEEAGPMSDLADAVGRNLEKHVGR